MDRRIFLAISVPPFAGLAWEAYRTLYPSADDRALYGPPQEIPIAEFSQKTGEQTGIRQVPEVFRSRNEWRRRLTSVSFRVTRQGATEAPFTGPYWNLHDPGLYQCICCDTAEFSSRAKFDSDTGWPSFWKPIASENLSTSTDLSLSVPRIAVSCRRCGAHLGHVFNDGPDPTGLRYCINSAALHFVARQG